jgi:multidrug transporter EmrE-like cation transporter
MAHALLLLYSLVTSLGLVFIKLGTEDGMPVKFLDGKLHFNLNFYAISGVLLYGLSFVLYMYLISKNDLGYIIPLTTALVYILIFVASYFIFHEVFTLTKIVGIVLIVAGLIFLNLNR